MNNQQFTHEFFYNKNRSQRYGNIHFEENNFFSYSTIISSIQKSTKDNKFYTLLAWDNMSNTTLKHINYLRSSSPYSIIYVPFEIGFSYFSLEHLSCEFLRRLNYFNDKNLKQAQNRLDCQRLYNNFIKFIDLFKIKVKQADLQVVNGLYNKALKIDEKRKKAKEKRLNLTPAELEKRQLENQKKKEKLLEKFKSGGYLFQVKTLFDKKSFMPNYQKKEYIKLLDTNKYSYVYPIKDGIKTSKSVEIPENIVKIALELWKNNKLKIGYHISFYTVREITEKYIQIGCHCIRQDNIKALYDYYFGA